MPGREDHEFDPSLCYFFLFIEKEVKFKPTDYLLFSVLPELHVPVGLEYGLTTATEGTSHTVSPAQ